MLATTRRALQTRWRAYAPVTVVNSRTYSSHGLGGASGSTAAHVRKKSKAGSQRPSRVLTGEELYAFHLNRKWKFPAFRPQARLFVAITRHEELASKLSQHLRTDPLAIFHSSNADIEQAAIALEVYLGRLQGLINANSKADIRQRLVSDHPGSCALIWLLENKHQKWLNMGALGRFQSATVHCLVGEGRQQDLWSWLDAESTQVPIHVSGEAKNTWKAQVFSSFIESVGYWATGQSPLDEVMQTLLQAFAINTEHRRAVDGRGPKIYLFPALRMMVQWLTTVDVHGVNLTLFDRICKWHRPRTTFDIDPRHRYDLARLELAHPKLQDPSQMLAFLEWAVAEGSEHPYVKDMFAHNDRSSTLTIFYTLKRTANTLQSRGNVKAARWVLDLGRTRLPDLFVSYNTSVQQLPHASVTGRPAFRRMATSKELEAGVLVDEDGHVMPSPQIGALIRNAKSRQ